MKSLLTNSFPDHAFEHHQIQILLCVSISLLWRVSFYSSERSTEEPENILVNQPDIPNMTCRIRVPCISSIVLPSVLMSSQQFLIIVLCWDCECVTCGHNTYILSWAESRSLLTQIGRDLREGQHVRIIKSNHLWLTIYLSLTYNTSCLQLVWHCFVMPWVPI